MARFGPSQRCGVASSSAPEPRLRVRPSDARGRRRDGLTVVCKASKGQRPREGRAPREGSVRAGAGATGALSPAGSQRWEACSRCPHSCRRPEECVHACLNVGPLDSADQEDLERLYTQAKEAYHSGLPMLSDDDFDNIESSLRYRRSSVVQKWPRCSVRDFKMYSDAEIDKSQSFALATFWTVVGFGSLVSVSQNTFGLLHADVLGTLNVIVAGALFLVANGALRSVLGGSEVAVKGSCPNCGEEVYSFVSFPAGGSDDAEVDSECHNCRRSLQFKIARHQGDDLEEEGTVPNAGWAYGRIVLRRLPEDYSPSKFGQEGA